MNKPYGYWTFEKCKEEALKYNSRSEFKKKSGGCWNKSRICGWLDNVCEHMICIGNRYNKCIYVYEFSDNYAYIGLTGNINRRDGEHLSNNKSQVFKHIKETNLTPILKQLTEYIDVDDAIKLEEYYLQEYINNKWVVLNVAKTGCIGGAIIKWDYNSCLEEALKHESRSSFKCTSVGAYESCVKNNWLEYVCSHMEELRKPNGYWTYENCKVEALKYNSRSEFKKTSSSSYTISNENGWLDDICSHMEEFRKPNGYWTYERCKEEALKYDSRCDFKFGSSGAYRISIMNNWLDEICSHMVEINKPCGYWTFERCQEEALKYNSRNEFKTKSNGAFDRAYNNKWIDEICSHMILKQKPTGYWTYENCKEESLKYRNRSEFKKLSTGAFESSKRNNWLDDFYPKIISEHNSQ
jgi:predicted GIY-YIG superfamily endonuclease